MSDELNDEMDDEGEDEDIPLEYGLLRCESREQARKCIADYCERFDLDPTKYTLSTRALTILSSLR